MNTATERPWMTALEMQFAAARTLQRLQAAPPRDALEMADFDAMRALPLSQSFAWSNETTQAVWQAAKTIPGDTSFTSVNLPSDICWWWFAWPLPIPMTNNTHDEDLPRIDTQHISALLINSTINSDGNFISVSDFRLTEYGPCLSSFFIAPRGATLDGILNGLAVAPGTHGSSHPTSARVRALSRFFLAACVWLEQRIIVTTDGHIERHRRKQIAREHNVPQPSSVKIVQLRRRESDAERLSDETESIDWSCQWIVNGHWRNQPYKNERKLIYILPFVKGPADKPLKVPKQTVYEVSR